MKRHRFVSVAVAALAVARFAHAADPAVTPTKEQCIAANENAQSLRQSGQLRASRTQLLSCISKSCPGPVREDCAARLNELENATPTIVFVAKAADGADLTAVKVTMDGAPLVDHLDGSAIAVEPGEHTFVLSTPGLASVTKKLVIYEGVKGRDEKITFASPPPTAVAPPPTSPVTPLAPPPKDEPAPDEHALSNGSTQRILGLALGGAGIVGIGVGTAFGLIANSTYHDATSHCPTTSTCSSDGVSGGNDAHTQATISTVAFIAGGALLAGGVVLYLTAPKRGAVSVQTAAAPGSLGLRIGGAF